MTNTHGPYIYRRYHRRSIRLQGYDYSQSNAYFVTICTYGKLCWLGEVQSDTVVLTGAGKIAHQAWNSLPDRFPHVQLDAFVVMPNHVHGIIIVGAQCITPTPPTSAPTSRDAPDPTIIVPKSPIPPPNLGIAPQLPSTSEARPRPAAKLGDVVRTFKALSTRLVRQDGTEPLGWQRNYYEHIIRNDRSLDRIRAYIATNPAHWDDDRFHPS